MKVKKIKAVKLAEHKNNLLGKRMSMDLSMVLLLFFALVTMALMTWSMDTAVQNTPASEPGTSGIPLAASMPAVEDPACAGIIRFHVKANSDSEEDQALKLQVRNHVLAKVQNHLMDCLAREMAHLESDSNGRNTAGSRLKKQTGAEMSESRRLELTRQWLEENLLQIEEWAEETVRAEGCTYSVTASLGVTWIPEREYDGIYFPPGNYEALTLSIGEGAGQNWWCVLFPPLCLIDCGEELGLARLEAIAGDRIILKSRILELLEKNRIEKGNLC